MNRSSDLSGIAAMLAATAVFVVGDSFMKLVTADLPPFETLFLRSIAASIACAVLVTLRGEWRVISGVFDVRALLRAIIAREGKYLEVDPYGILVIRSVSSKDLSR